MSLEIALAANTAAILELTAAWKQLTANAVAIKAGEAVNAGGVPVIPAKAKVESPKPAATPAPTPAVAVEVTTASPEIAKDSPSEVTYEMVSKAILAMATADRPRLVATLTQFGVKRGPELKPEQFSTFLEAMA
jgi:hypothetical protein